MAVPGKKKGKPVPPPQKGPRKSPKGGKPGNGGLSLVKEGKKGASGAQKKSEREAATPAEGQEPLEEFQKTDQQKWEYVTVEVDANGQKYLPGQEPKVIKEFYLKLKERQVIADEQAARAKRLSELNEDISSLGRKYRDEFRPAVKPNVLEYHCAGFLVEVEKTEVEKTTVHKESTKELSSSKAGEKSETAGKSGSKKSGKKGNEFFAE